MEAFMRLIGISIMALMLGSSAALAQVTTMPGGVTSSALGATSPLGTLGMSSSAPAASPSIPLGVTQLNVGGLSPSPGPLAGSACSTVSGLSSTATGTFDGGGMSAATAGMSASGMGGAITGSTSGCGTAGAGTNTTGLMTAGSSGASAGGLGGIPLGATEIDSGGLSPMITTPAPSTIITTPGMSSSP